MPDFMPWELLISISISRAVTESAPSHDLARPAQPQNLISLEKHGGASWVTELRYASPLRIFEVGRGVEEGPSRLMLSNHGGGMLQGDQVQLRINAGQDTWSEIRSQANTQILNNPRKVVSSFSLRGELEEHSRHQFLGEPVVMHKNAMYSQDQQWRLSRGSRLVLLDWFQSGRSDSGEKYAFQSYSSELRISYDGTPILAERFRIEPAVNDVHAPVACADFDHVVNVYLAGDHPRAQLENIRLPANPSRLRNKPLGSAVHGQQASEHSASTAGMVPGAYFSLTMLPSCCVIRAMGRSRLDIQPVLDRILQAFVE